MSTSVHIEQSLAHTKISQDKPHSRPDVCDQQRLINPSQIVEHIFNIKQPQKSIKWTKVYF